jgi:hypothetical protein
MNFTRHATGERAPKVSSENARFRRRAAVDPREDG